jgi:bifunctional DNA-binding transcriptional regulator/antitoxin component of YhaV-PrlF toxin-antitoxin module
MKLQKHPSRKAKSGEDYYKYEVILPKRAVREAGFKEGDELEAETQKGEIKLKKK